MDRSCVAQSSCSALSFIFYFVNIPDLHNVNVGILLHIAIVFDGSRLKHGYAADIGGRDRHMRS